MSLEKIRPLPSEEQEKEIKYLQEIRYKLPVVFWSWNYSRENAENSVALGFRRSIYEAFVNLAGQEATFKYERDADGIQSQTGIIKTVFIDSISIEPLKRKPYGQCFYFLSRPCSEPFLKEIEVYDGRVYNNFWSDVLLGAEMDFDLCYKIRKRIESVHPNAHKFRPLKSDSGPIQHLDIGLGDFVEVESDVKKLTLKNKQVAGSA